MFERFGATEQSGGEKEKDPAIARIRKFFELQFNKIDVIGRENITKIPKGKKVIVVTTHLSDRDVPLAIGMLGDEFESVGWAEASTHEKFRENPGGYIGRKLSGSEHSYSVDTTKAGGAERGVFNPDDFEPMKEALSDGKTMFVAGYYKSTNDWKLPDRGGYGAVLLAQTQDTVLLPVAINTKTKEQTGMGAHPLKAITQRPDVDVVIGEPFELGKIFGAERMGEIMKSRKDGPLSKEDREEFSSLSEKLRGESDVVMEHLAELLPEDKRGAWVKRGNSD